MNHDARSRRAGNGAESFLTRPGTCPAAPVFISVQFNSGIEIFNVKSIMFPELLASEVPTGQICRK